MASRLQDVLQVGTRAAQPVATDVAIGTVYAVSDEDFLLEQSDGSAWNQWGPTPAAGVAITALTGDVTATGPGSAAATIANTAVTAAKIASNAVETAKILNANVTYAKIQNVADGKLLGNFSGGAAAPSEYSLGAGLEESSGVRTKAAIRTFMVGITVDGGGSVFTTGVKGYKSIPWTGTITAVRMIANASGSCVIDIWKDTFANAPPTVADTITASAKPTLSSAQKSEDTTLTGWTTAVTAGDVLGFNVDSVTTITRVTLELTILITG